MTPLPDSADRSSRAFCANVVDGARGYGWRAWEAQAQHRSTGRAGNLARDAAAHGRDGEHVSLLRGNPGVHHLCAAGRPARAWQERTAGGARPTGSLVFRRLAGPHLPQGAPTSPAAANLLAHRLDRRLAGLAAAIGAEYGRYADDLVFSGDRGLPAHGLVGRVMVIAAEEGFRVRPDKTRVMPDHHRQRITGLVVNARPAVSHVEYDALRALLHNCVRTGPAAQNRAGHPAFRDHLLGRISWVAAGHPGRGSRLRAAFEQIDWS